LDIITPTGDNYSSEMIHIIKKLSGSYQGNKNLQNIR